MVSDPELNPMLIQYGLSQQPQRLVVRHPHLQMASNTRRDSYRSLRHDDASTLFPDTISFP